MGASQAAVLLVALALLAGSACSEADAPPPRNALRDGAITVGSFDFPESEVLAEIYSQAIEAKGVEVRRAFDLGPREYVIPALAGGLLEFVPEYAGTALQFLSVDPTARPGDGEATHRALARVAGQSHLVALAPAPAQDSNVFVVSRETAERKGLRTLSDLAATDSDSELVFGGPPECATRPLCLVGLERVYGLEFEDVLSLDAGGPLTGQALRAGAIEIGLLFSTDPALADAGLVALEDDKALQPAENITPLVRSEVVDRWGSRLVEQIDAVSERLTTEELREFNAQLDDGASVADVASRWLEQEGIS